MSMSTHIAKTPTAPKMSNSVSETPAISKRIGPSPMATVFIPMSATLASVGPRTAYPSRNSPST
jgi:hypothetical protein